MISSATAAPYVGQEAALERNTEKEQKTTEKINRILEETVKANEASEQALRDENAILRARLAENDAASEAKDKALFIQKFAIVTLERENWQQRVKNSQLSERDILLQEMVVIQKELVDKAPTLWKFHSVEEAIADIRRKWPLTHHEEHESRWRIQEYQERGYAYHEGMPTFNHLLRIHEMIKKAESLPKE